MYKGQKIAVAVPAYNEEKLIGEVIKTMPPLVDLIVIVDDQSADRTFDIASKSTDPRVIAIRHEKNTGVGGAIMTAHHRILEEGADIAVVMAGDGQMDPDYLPALLNPIADDGYDYAKGNRFWSEDSLRGMPRYRVFGNVVLTFMTKMASGYWNLFDPQNGYTAIRTDALKELPLGDIRQGYVFENDMLIHLNIANKRIKDVAIPAKYGNEQSSIKLWKIIPQFMNFLTWRYFHRIYHKYVLQSFSPIALFLLSGFLLTAWGIGFGIWVIVQTIGPATASTGTVILSVIPFMTGFQLLLAALVLDIIAEPK